MNRLSIGGLHPPGATSPGLNWRRALGYGVLWAIVCSAMESFALPLGMLSLTDLLQFNLRAATEWFAIGIVLASALLVLEPRLTPAQLAPALLGFSLAATGGLALANELLLAPTSIAFGSNYLHAFWGCLCYGGVFIAVYRMSQRGERTRALLAQAEIARQRSEAALGAAQVQALQGQIDPAFLLRVMAEVERRYAAAPATVDHLLDPLIGFLRAAMPGVRSGTSTLAAEVLLAMRYAQLVAAFAPGGNVHAIRVDGTVPDLPFPPLLLLPVLDALGAAQGDGGTTLQVVRHEGRCTLTLTRAGWSGNDVRMPPELLYRLQVGLRTLFGDGWALALCADAGSPALTLTLPMPSTGGAEPVPPTRVEALRSHLEKTHHG